MDIRMSEIAGSKARKKVLIAELPEFHPIAEKTLSHSFDLVLVSALEHAKQVVNDGYDAYVCCTHFDNGKMFDLLRYAKEKPASKNVPFICMKVVDDNMSPAIYRGIVSAARILGADDFLDLRDSRTGYRADLSGLGRRLKLIFQERTSEA